MLNILTEPVIRVHTGKGVIMASLPEVYAALMADDVTAFPGLRPYPRHSWHAFLVQLGAMAMHRDGASAPPDDAGAWANLIRGLTPDWADDEPWQLVVDDITKPAFMQPPAQSAGKLPEYKNTVATPDDLDMLVTSKNHDLKSAVIADASADDWLFALVSLQTMEGFGGAGNYGISRMNGGLGSRPAFSLTPSTRPGAHVRRDIVALLEHHSSLLSNSGHTLLWTLPWDGTGAEALTLNRLAPLYIEVCRRVRMRSAQDGRLYAIRTSSKAARVNAKTSNGITDDPWTPIDLRDKKKGDKALSLSRGGFTYRRITTYLDTSEFRWPPLMELTPDERRLSKPMQLVARAMVRGQGKTEGYHERVIPLRAGAIRIQELGFIAKERVYDVNAVQNILRRSIATFAARGDSGNISPDCLQTASPWVNQLNEIVDTHFFDDLQFELGQDDRAMQDSIRNDWRRDFLLPKARRILDDATDSLPCPAMLRYEARANARGLFEGRIRNDGRLADVFAPQGADDD